MGRTRQYNPITREIDETCSDCGTLMKKGNKTIRIEHTKEQCRKTRKIDRDVDNFFESMFG